MNNRRNGSSGRQIDEAVSQTTRKVRTGFTAVPSMKIKTWKAALILLFVAGFFLALIWGAYNSWYIGSQAADTPDLLLTLTANPTSGPAPLKGVTFTASVTGKLIDSGKVRGISYFFYCNAPDTATTIAPWGVPANYDRRNLFDGKNPVPVGQKWTIGTYSNGAGLCDQYYSKRGKYWPTVYAIVFNSGTVLNTTVPVPVKVEWADVNDTSVPKRSGGRLLFGGMLPRFVLNTDVVAQCRYSLSAGQSFDSMTKYAPKEYVKAHEAMLPLKTKLDQKIYVRCKDKTGNTNSNDYVISAIGATWQ